MTKNTPNLALVVDYSATIEKMVKRGRYDRNNSNITSENFPTTRSGKVEIETKIFHFNKHISSEDVIVEMNQEGYRPAELHELLAFGEKYPEEQINLPIVELGSVCQHPSAIGDVAILYDGRLGRELGLTGFCGGWAEDLYRFLAVRK